MEGLCGTAAGRANVDALLSQRTIVGAILACTHVHVRTHVRRAACNICCLIYFD
jgi:hypothetical protein